MSGLNFKWCDLTDCLDFLEVGHPARMEQQRKRFSRQCTDGQQSSLSKVGAVSQDKVSECLQPTMDFPDLIGG